MKTALVAVPVFALSVLVAGCSSGDSSIKSFASEEERAEAFCDVVEQINDIAASYDVENVSYQMQVTMENAMTDSDPSAIAAVQTWGSMLDEMTTQGLPLYEELLTIADDPQLRTALEIAVHLNKDVVLPLAKDAMTVTTISESQSLMMDLMVETMDIASNEDSLSAVLALTTYSETQCGLPLTTTF